MTVQQANQTRRLDLILQQLDALPTLPAVVMKLLQVIDADESNAQQVVELVRADPSLTVKVLALCQSTARTQGSRQEVATLDRAVVMLGFDAVRNAVLSIKVFEIFSKDAGAPDSATIEFDRAAFWRHSLAVGLAAELIAASQRKRLGVNPEDAFVCGLLHDIGKLALDHVLPRSYQRVIELTEQQQRNIADIEKRVIGLDHHTAGKRLAEHWQLPHLLIDAIWLHGTPLHLVPELDHKRMIGLIGLADVLVRRNHIGYSGNHNLRDSIRDRAEALGLDVDEVEKVVAQLHEAVQRHSAALGLGDQPTRDLFLASIMQANAVLGRVNEQLEAGRRLSARQGMALDAIVRFHAAAAQPGRSVQDVLAAVVQSAASVLGEGFYATVYQPARNDSWVLTQYAGTNRAARSALIDPPPSTANLAQLTDAAPTALDLMGLLPSLADDLTSAKDIRQVRVLPLPCGWGAAAVLLHDRPALPHQDVPAALVHTWGAAVAAATQHEGARRLGEQLVELNRELAETQDTLLRNQSMARVGEMAAGAAHEMNNPLAVISGRAQLLAGRLSDAADRRTAELIYDQAQRLSDLITALRLFADPPPPQRMLVEIDAALEEAVRYVQMRHPQAPAIVVEKADRLPELHTDPEQLGTALGELLVNAHQSQPKQAVRVTVHVDPLNDRLVMQVIDDGVGMDAHTLEHAFDPFFSVKPAGRQVGLGLARARRLMESLGGDIVLESDAERGTTATLTHPLSVAEQTQRPATVTAARGDRLTLGGR